MALNELKANLESHKMLFSTSIYNKFEIYGQELLKWNKVHNLSGASSMLSVEDNIYDSLYPLKFINNFKNCLDIGSGGGFPSLPLAIVREDARFYLVEPRSKRAAFLQHIVAHLKLYNVKIFPCTIQEVALNQVGSVELLTSRAALSIQEIVHYGRKFLSSQGYYLLYKGLNLKNEVRSLNVEECFKRDSRIYYYKQNY